jgi:hypothetical protein
MGEAICLPIIGFSILQIRNCAPERSCARVLHHPHQSGLADTAGRPRAIRYRGGFRLFALCGSPSRLKDDISLPRHRRPVQDFDIML